jgi:DNA topoisomerase I
MAGKNLVIVESPAKAKTINKYLGSDYEVVASFGHIRDLLAKDGSVEPDADFAMHWEVDSDATKRVKAISDSSKAANRLILATDPDREGEAISWHLYEVLKAKKALPKGGVQRVTFNEITKSAVTAAMKAPRDLDQPLVDAYLARRALDYLVGFTLSPVLWRKLPGAKSAGRVQSVALRIICDREMEIEAFRTQEYWTVDATLTTAKGDSFTARLTQLDGKRLDKFDLGEEAKARAAQQLVQASRYSVSSLEQKPATRNPYAPFTTSTLQQEAARKLGFSAQHTMRIAQGLYEGISIGGETTGLITYMRTDGVSISADAIAQARSVIAQKHGDAYVPEKPRLYTSKAKNAQEAHEGIRPTDLAREPKSLSAALTADQLKLYELIWKRTIASQMASARMERTTVDLLSDDKKSQLRATGQVVLFAGFLALYEESHDESAQDDDSKRLPQLLQGDTPKIGEAKADQHFTEAPPRYSEASLVKKLEELGIGRPSTYASILQVLRDRGYVVMDRNRFIPQQGGRLLSAFLENFFNRYVDYDFTAKLEEQLDEVSAGGVDWKTVLRAFWLDFKPKTEEIMEQQPSAVMAALDIFLEDYLYKAKTPDGDPRLCPKCGVGRLNLRGSRNGAFVGCASYPECKYTRPFGPAEESEKKAAAAADNILGTDPDTGEAITLRSGRFGPYVQRGEGETPKRASIPRDIGVENTTFEIALKLLCLPRVLGTHPDDAADIIANIGRYGPYLQHNKKYAKLQSSEEAFTVGMNMAVALLAAPPKYPKKGEARAPTQPLKEVGAHPDSGETIRVMPGKYGPYVTDGSVNATVPKDQDPTTVSLDQAVNLLAERAAKIAAGGGGKRPAKKVARKGVAKKAAPPKKAAAPKKAVAKKAPAKKAAAKKSAKAK